MLLALRAARLRSRPGALIRTSRPYARDQRERRSGRCVQPAAPVERSAHAPAAIPRALQGLADVPRPFAHMLDRFRESYLRGRSVCREVGGVRGIAARRFGVEVWGESERYVSAIATPT